jgi:hypothetical protein
MELRDDIDTVLPEGVDVTINTNECANGKGSITLTIMAWPKNMLANNYERVVAGRKVLLAGFDLRTVDLSSYDYLSAEAAHLAATLQALVDKHCPSEIDPTTGREVWNINGCVNFDPRSLERERIEIVQSLKEPRTA